MLCNVGRFSGNIMPVRAPVYTLACTPPDTHC